MHKEEFECSRIVVELASSIFLTLEARSKRDSDDRGRERDWDREPKIGPQAKDKCYNCDKMDIGMNLYMNVNVEFDFYVF